MLSWEEFCYSLMRMSEAFTLKSEMENGGKGNSNFEHC